MTETTNNSSSTGGVGFVGLLTVLFIGLKLTGYISWSWGWVLSPIWITFIVILTFIVIVPMIFITVKHFKGD